MAYLKNWTDNFFQIFVMGISWVAVSINNIKTRASSEMTSRKKIFFYFILMGWTLRSTGIWRGAVFAISDCLVSLGFVLYHHPAYMIVLWNINTRQHVPRRRQQHTSSRPVPHVHVHNMTPECHPLHTPMHPVNYKWPYLCPAHLSSVCTLRIRKMQSSLKLENAICGLVEHLRSTRAHCMVL